MHRFCVRRNHSTIRLTVCWLSRLYFQLRRLSIAAALAPQICRVAAVWGLVGQKYCQKARAREAQMNKLAQSELVACSGL